MSVPKEIRVRDRHKNRIFVEPLYDEAKLRFLYEHPLGRFFTDLVLRREWVSHIVGWLKRSPRSRPQIRDYIDRLGVNEREAEFPVACYRSLDDFFTRRLRSEVRPIDDAPSHFISPCDGRVLVYPFLEDQVLRVKGSCTSLAQLLEDPELVGLYAGGAALVVRLAPADYHRFHFPDGGMASRARYIRGGLHSVHPVALEAGAAAFRNKRAMTRLRSDSFGELLLVEVGAMIVGTIVQTYRPGRVERGTEKGMFRFGGSTVIVLIPKGRVIFDDDLVQASGQNLESLVKMGSRIGRMEN